MNDIVIRDASNVVLLVPDLVVSAVVMIIIYEMIIEKEMRYIEYGYHTKHLNENTKQPIKII